jgi:hypothetical protein
MRKIQTANGRGTIKVLPLPSPSLEDKRQRRKKQAKKSPREGGQTIVS